MQEWIIDNYKWLFSGAGVFILSLVITILFKKRRNRNAQKNTSGNMNNNVTARNVNINQTIVSNFKGEKADSEVDDYKEPLVEIDQDVERIKEKYAVIGKKIRTELIKKLEETKIDKSVFKVHHMTDVMEQKYGMNYELVTSELEKLAGDGRITLVDQSYNTISPYTEIRVVTSKFFDSL